MARVNLVDDTYTKAIPGGDVGALSTHVDMTPLHKNLHIKRHRFALLWLNQ
ncbi:hypothetical protein J6590_033091 [Homalodisca vitripennis]|nr:hypothetical protein J6590_033091 [Homalodisca vitripennis]